MFVLNYKLFGSFQQLGPQNSLKCGRDGIGRQDRDQKRPQTWPGRGHKAGPGTKTALNVAGTGSEGRTGNKNGPKRGRDRVTRQGREQKGIKRARDNVREKGQ